MSAEPSRVHPTAFVGPGVELGIGVVVGPYAVLLGPSRIGDRAWIGPGAHIGGAPEIAALRRNSAWDGDLDHHLVAVGGDTVVRDGVVIHHGSVRPTIVGERCQLFSHAYVAHDVNIGDGVTLSAGTSIGGHASIRSGANLGLNVSVHQRRSVGALAMVGMGSAVTRDVPPFATTYGVPSRVRGVNRFGMARSGLSEVEIACVESLFAGTDLELGSFEDPGMTARVWDELRWWAELPGRLDASWALSGAGKGPAVDAGNAGEASLAHMSGHEASTD